MTSLPYPLAKLLKDKGWPQPEGDIVQSGHWITKNGKTSSEAVANLWLALKEEEKV